MPAGVDRGLWDYLHDPGIARRYDDSLADSSLFDLDQRFILEHLPSPDGASSPPRLLDLGCGTGRLLLPLARKGFWVLGVDLSPQMLAVAREKAQAAGLPVHLLQANLAELDGIADAGFDHAVCMFSTLGMIIGSRVRERVLGHIHRILRPGGRFILHVHNRWFHLTDPPGRRWLVQDQFRRFLGRLDAGDRIMPPHQGLGPLVMHLFGRRETTRLLQDAGFRIRTVCPVGLGAQGRLPAAWWLPSLRAYGFLIAAERP